MKRGAVLLGVLLFSSLAVSAFNDPAKGRNKRHFRIHQAGFGAFYGFPAEPGAHFRLTQYNYESFDILGESPLITWGPSVSGALSYDFKKHSPYARLGAGYEHAILMILTGIRMDAYWLTDLQTSTCALAPSAGFHFYGYELYYAAEVPLLNRNSYNIEHRITLTRVIMPMKQTLRKVIVEDGKKTVTKVSRRSN